MQMHVHEKYTELFSVRYWELQMANLLRENEKTL